jgi:hypothetical protein
MVPGMDSEKLSRRTKQPGHDQTFRASEANFMEVARRCLDPSRYRVEEQPRDLAHIFDDQSGESVLGVQPEAVVESLTTKRRFFVEVKKQGPRGNAEERACKHHTVRFVQHLHDLYGYDYHPYVTVFCENLATDRRYTLKFRYLFEPDNYFLWVGYDLDNLKNYLEGRCQAWLD